jgi:hypothetical protein
LIVPGWARTTRRGLISAALRWSAGPSEVVSQGQSRRDWCGSQFEASTSFEAAFTPACNLRHGLLSRLEQETSSRESPSPHRQRPVWPASRYRATTTGVPTLTLSNRSTMSWLYMRMQPYDAKVPIEDGLLVP